MLLNLSKSLIKSADLRNLALSGLKMEADEVEIALTNNPSDLNSAAYHVLKLWRNGYENAAVAYNILCQALRKVKLASHITRLTET